MVISLKELLSQTLLAMSAKAVFDNLFAVFMMLGGLAVFMYGMKLLGENLENLAGTSIKKLLGKATSNRFAGIGVGAGVTAIIQSSSATTVMLVGFVNVGLMTLTQAAAVIMGANIGTTITVQLVSLKAFNVLAVVCLVAGIGLFMQMFGRSGKIRLLGVIFISLGMIFIGLEFMSDSMQVFQNNETFMRLFQTLDNPFLLLLVGMVFTALIQSSLAATTILAGFVAVGGAGMGMSLDGALFAILGINIGTCITAVLSAIGANTNAKRTACMHVLFNVVGALVMFVILLFIHDQSWFIKGISLGAVGADGIADPLRQLANFHTLFNVFTTLILIPFLPLLVKLCVLIIPAGKKEREKNKRLQFLDERLLETPAVAISELVNEIDAMAKLAKENLDLSVNALYNGDNSVLDEVKSREEELNYLTKATTEYMIKISAQDISYDDEVFIGSLFHVVSDIERVGDYADNVVNYIKKMERQHVIFTEDALSEIKEMYDTVSRHFELSLKVFVAKDLSGLAEVARVEESIDDLKLKMADNHILRLNNGSCTAEAGAIYLSLASNFERIADHMTNIAFSIRKYTKVKGVVRKQPPAVG